MKSKSTLTIGVDVGGSHISCAAVDSNSNEFIPHSYSIGKVNNKADKESIFREWSQVINRTLEKVKDREVVGIGIAMPGPFDYEKGIGLFEGNEKYEALYHISVAAEFPVFLDRKGLPLRFINDASSFGLGSCLRQKERSRTLAITLGTGFGAAFIIDQVPITEGNGIPVGGCLWDKTFLEGIADDYFSTRWFTRRYFELAGKEVSGVKEIVEANDNAFKQVFEEFSINLNSFLLPYLKNFSPDHLIIGGNIARAQQVFLPGLKKTWENEGIQIPISIVEDTEKTSILGASYYFNTCSLDKLQGEGVIPVNKSVKH